jgi:hypothetical protein
LKGISPSIFRETSSDFGGSYRRPSADIGVRKIGGRGYFFNEINGLPRRPANRISTNFFGQKNSLGNRLKLPIGEIATGR